MILQVVAAGPIHGYALAQRIRLISRDLLQIQQGSLYPALHRLENRGLLAAEWEESETGRDAKFYRLTPKGRAQLKKETADWARLSEAIALILQRSRGRCAMNWWQRLRNRDRLERELDAELRYHFDREVADNLRMGMSEEEARRRARLDLGGDDQLKESCRDARGTRWVDDIGAGSSICRSPAVEGSPVHAAGRDRPGARDRHERHDVHDRERDDSRPADRQARTDHVDPRA